MGESPLENAPSDDQKRRLSDWLTELKIICARYRLALDTEDGETRVIDVTRGTTIGIGVSFLIEEKKGRRVITAYDCTGSILDGVWLIDTPTGTVEQRTLGRVLPAPENEDFH
jgi:hypothetical protein